jgi:ATP-dependent DNA helicase RecQ
LHEKGWILLESKQMTDVYQILNNQFDSDGLAQDLYQQFKQKEQAQIQRIKEILDLFQSQQCLSQQLATYFGDFQINQTCGHCSVCLGNYQPWPQTTTLNTIQVDELKSTIDTLNQSIVEQFSQPASIDLMCRYLCGISSPWLIKVRAKGLGHFSRYEKYGYAQIYMQLKNIVVL